MRAMGPAGPATLTSQLAHGGCAGIGSPGPWGPCAVRPVAGHRDAHAYQYHERPQSRESPRRRAQPQPRPHPQRLRRGAREPAPAQAAAQASDATLGAPPHLPAVSRTPDRHLAVVWALCGEKTGGKDSTDGPRVAARGWGTKSEKEDRAASPRTLGDPWRPPPDFPGLPGGEPPPLRFSAAALGARVARQKPELARPAGGEEGGGRRLLPGASLAAGLRPPAPSSPARGYPASGGVGPPAAAPPG